MATPNIDALAAGGLLYNNMHTTALCSPSRSCIITGRNHHANGMAAITELATGYPGYDGNIPYVRQAVHRVSSAEEIPEGRHELRFEFEPTGAPDIAHGRGTPGRAQLYIDRRLAGEAEIPVTTPVAFNPGGMTCGANPGSAVVPDYEPPFRFTGILHTVTVDLSGDLIADIDNEIRMRMARQ